MKQILIKECGSCGLGYYKPWYEPMWLARKNWIEAHKSYHGNSQRDYGKDLEQERIIKLLEERRREGNWCQAAEYCNHSLTCHEVWDWLENSIALIKGEK